MKSVIFLIVSLSFIFSQSEENIESGSKINFSGDARIRPRLDVKNYVGDKIIMDLYYLYRARFNLNVDFEKGWFFKTRIGTNDVSSMVKMGVDGTDNKIYYDKEDDNKEYIYSIGYTDGPGNSNSARPQISFLNLYYGFKKESFGFWGGAIPLKYNPGLDIHFYPDKIVDIPWLLFNNGSTTGFSGYIYKINWFLSIDGNEKEIVNTKEQKITDEEGNTIKIIPSADEKNIDYMTFGFDFSMKWNQIIETIHPRAIFSIANTNKPWPISFGWDINFISFFGITPTILYNYSTQFVERTNVYNITHLRFKLDGMVGPGKLTFWTDVASHIDKKHSSGVENYTTNFLYLWIDYKYKIFNNNFGSCSIKPTIRILDKKSSDEKFNRMKFELTTEIKFK